MSDDNGSPPTILIIEDDVSLRRMYELAFTINKFTVFTADDGVSGLDELRVKKPDIVLLDIMMPNEDGYFVLDAVREDQTVSSIPIIVLSNLTGENYEKDARSKGAVDFIVKSDVDPKEVVAVVNKTLAAHQQQSPEHKE